MLDSIEEIESLSRPTGAARALTEADVRAAMREVRVALLEADVGLPVARDFVDKEIIPHVQGWCDTDTLPRELMLQMGR